MRRDHSVHRSRIGISLLIMLFTLYGCVEEFNAELPSADTCMLVVEGAIVGDTVSTFTLTHTVSMDADAWDPSINAISNAVVSVVGNDGCRWEAISDGKGTYQAILGTLTPEVAYQLEIRWNGETYASTPALPLPTPDITDLQYGLSEWGPDAVIYLSTDTPVPNSDETSEEEYFFWNCQEDWEINTPFPGSYFYDAEKDSIIPKTLYLGRGWCHNALLPIIGATADYAGGCLADYPLYTVGRHDNRFNTLYAITVTQRAVSREEYEYERLLEQQSYDMGGLFTPLPSALPGNVFCTSDASLQAIGYVGVSAGTTSRRLFISRADVGHVPERNARDLNDDELGQHTMYELYTLGYRVHLHSILGTSWTWRWCVDCTDPYWGATRIRPDFWPQDNEYER